MINTDGLNNAPPAEVAQGAMVLLDAVQRIGAPHLQVASAAAMFLVLLEHFRANPQDVFVAVKNLLNDERPGGGKAPEFEALRLYVKHEIRR